MRPSRPIALAAASVLGAGFALGQDAPPPIEIHRAAGTIAIDGQLTDPGWRGAARIDRFWEGNPGNNIEPPVKTTALLTYDERFLYIGLICEDPHPDRIRAPYVDRDNIIGTDDNVAVFLDTRGDRRSAFEFRVNPRGQQADGSFNDANGNEDFSPDFFYDTAARITATGWEAEMRIPFSSLRYAHGRPNNWGILLWRNYPRDFRYGIYNAPIPRDSNCLICHAVPLEGLADLPSGGHLIAAPYATLTEQGVPRDGPGSDFRNKPARGTGGLDLKWIPGPSTAVDATINPDFSQVESDVGQISINKSFAIFFPEKRPFFLEGVDLLDTPIQAVYTRTITSPRWGARATGKFDDTAYTFLLTQDRGGGTVIIPGPTSSDFAPQDFSSIVAIGRARKDFGGSFAGILLTDRENASSDGGGHNRVLGTDFQWRPNQHDQVTGQILASDTQTPDRPDLYAGWDGRRFSSRAMYLEWRHTSYHWFSRLHYEDFGDGFRTDVGFVPQVGHRFEKIVAGYSVYDLGFFSQISGGSFCNLAQRSDGALVQRQCGLFVNPSGFHDLGGEIDLVPRQKDRFGETVVDSDFVMYYDVVIDPGRVFSRIELSGFVGDHADVVNARPGNGAEVGITATVKPFDHLALDFNGDRQWLDVDAHGRSGRLFTAQIARLKATYNFNTRSFLRLIGEYFRATRDPELYDVEVPSLEKTFTGSALFAYRINWQTVFFLGYGDSHVLNENNALVPASRDLFLKVSYAFQL
jgi:hypothetical protein